MPAYESNTSNLARRHRPLIGFNRLHRKTMASLSSPQARLEGASWVDSVHSEAFDGKSVEVTESMLQVLILAGSRPLVSGLLPHISASPFLRIMTIHSAPVRSCACVRVVSIVFTLIIPSGDCPSAILPI